MNRIVKIIVISINVLMLIFSFFWYFENKNFEPLIVLFGQISTLLVLLFEGTISKNILSKIDNSKIKIKNKNSTNTIRKVKDSKIDIGE